MKVKNVQKRDWSNKEYHSRIDFLGRSGIVKFRDGPDVYDYLLKNPPTGSEPLVVGSAFHTWLLERENYTNEFHELKEKMTFYKKENKDFKAKLKAKGVDLLQPEQQTLIKEMSEVVEAHPTWKQIAISAEKEVTFTYEKAGVKLKTRPDFINEEMKIVGDVKTIEKINKRQLKWKFLDYGYDIQAAMGLDAVQAYYGGTWTWVNVWVQKSKPYRVLFTTIDRQDEERARRKYEETLEPFKTCLENDYWPSPIGQGVEVFGLGMEGATYEEQPQTADKWAVFNEE